MNIKSFNCSAVTLQLVAVLLLQQKFHNFATAFSVISYSPTTRHQRTTTVAVYSSPSPSDDDDGDDKGATIDVTGTVAEPITKEEKDSAVGNLVVNDEWEGLTMELSDLIQTAVGKLKSIELSEYKVFRFNFITCSQRESMKWLNP